MIRINLVKKEKREFKLPDLSKLKEIQVKDILQDKFVFVIPVLGAVAIGAELFVLKKMKDEVALLESKAMELKTQRDNLKRQANEIQAKKSQLESRIRSLKNTINYLNQSKDVIIALKEYYVPFNRSITFLRTSVPNTVWFDRFSQDLDFGKVAVNLSFGSYDLDSIKNFYRVLKKEYSKIKMSGITKKENSFGIIYYVSSINVEKDVGGVSK